MTIYLGTVDYIVSRLKESGDKAYLDKLKRFGVQTDSAIGTPLPEIRKLAKLYKKNHELAISLWKTGIHEARILASMIDDPKQVTRKQVYSWTSAFNSWDLCDQVCMNLFDRTGFAIDIATELSKSEKEFVKRAGFVIVAAYAIHNKSAEDKQFIEFLPLIKQASIDERNFVKKGVSWCLRQIGKRNANLNKIAIKTAKEISVLNNKSAKWIGKDALKELQMIKHK